MKIKKILSLLLILLLLTGLMPQIALAADTVSIDLSTVDASGTGYTFEAITVNSMPEYVVTITTNGSYTLTGTVTQETRPVHVVVSAPVADVTLSGVDVTIVNFSPIGINSGTAVNLTLAEGTENTLNAGLSEVAFAGIYVPVGASLVIDGTGILNASGGLSGAGIGGSYNPYAPSTLNREAGMITINGGIINAVGGVNGAGIGGASEGNGGTVTINGGEVTATSNYSVSYGAAGIGGGFHKWGDILITGGTVIATSGNHGRAEAIGSYVSASASQVIISGGSVRSHSPMRYVSTPKNSSGMAVYQTVVTVQDNSGNLLNDSDVSFTVDGTTSTAKTDVDGKLYLWLPAGNTSIYITSGGAEYWAVGTVATDDNSVLTTDTTPKVSINGTDYTTWAEAVTAVRTGETLTLLKDITILVTDTMPAVACTLDGNFHTLTLSGDQNLNADINLKNLCLSYTDMANTATLSCTDSQNTAHKLTINGTVGVGNVYIEKGSELLIEGILEVNEISTFDMMKVISGSSVSAFAVRNIGNLELNGTITCKYFLLKKASADSGTLTGNGTFLFTESGGESPNLSFKNVIIDESTQINLDALGYSPSAGQLLIGNKAQESAPATALDNIDRLVLSGAYATLKFTEHNYGFEYDYRLSAKITLKAPSISLASDTVNGGLAYTITPAADETGTVDSYAIQMVESDGATEVGDVINSSTTSGNIPLSSTLLSDHYYGAKVKAIAGATSGDLDSNYSSVCTTSQAAEQVVVVPNTIPTRKAGVPATATANVESGSAYTLDLSNIFVDADHEAMTYKVSINGALPVTANANYVYTTTSAGITIFEFTANDGKADSEESYTVTLTAIGTGNEPTISSVSVNPASVEVQRGTALTFSATVKGTTNAAQTVTWSVVGGDPDTSIDPNGVLTVDMNETASTLTVIATSVEDLTKSGSAVVTLTPQTYALTLSVGTGGCITTGSSGSYGAGTRTNLVATPSANYSFKDWTSTGGGSFDSATSASTTFTMPAEAVSITANFTFNGSSGGSTDHSSNERDKSSESNVSPVSTIQVPTTVYTPELFVIDPQTGVAVLTLGAQAGNALKNGETVTITAPSTLDVNTYALDIPVAYLSTTNVMGTLNFNTNAGRIALLSNMLAGIEGEKAEISISQGDKKDLPEDVKEAIGERPLINLEVKIDGKQIEWHNSSTPVSISIPYTPTKAELEVPESILIWYIDGSGDAVAVPNGRYDFATGTVTFSTTHFSHYAVGYNNVSFTDVPASAWYHKAVNYIATRGITTGTGNGKFSPEAKLTRGEFIVMMMKAYSIPADTDMSNNFSDAGQTYYTGYLASAKRLGIADGIGQNRFAPDQAITRQEMVTLLYNALKRIGALPKGNSGMQLETFSDKGQVLSWAEDAMTLFVSTGIVSGSGEHIYPNTSTSRAEMTQILYNLMTR